MKSLVLKDLFNIGHNAKAMMFMLIVFALVIIPQTGGEAYIVTSGILCSMMIITTFSFDDNSKWMRYAMIMPVSKKDIVKSKFVVLFIFCIIGVAVGFVIGMGGSIIYQIIVGIEMKEISILTFIGVSLIALVISMVFGSITIPLLFKFGAEKARTLSLVSFVVPVVICYTIYKVLVALGVTVTEKLLTVLLVCSPIFALFWCYLMYSASYKIFLAKESIL